MYLRWFGVVLCFTTFFTLCFYKIDKKYKPDPAPQMVLDEQDEESSRYVYSNEHPAKEEKKMKEVAEMIESLRFALDSSRERELDNTSDLRRIIRHELNLLDEKLGIKKWRSEMSNDLKETIFRTIDTLQNPKNCTTAKKLHCQIPKGYGFGAGIQDLLWCGFNAYIQRKMLIVLVNDWEYAPQGWDAFFRPLSRTCPYTLNFTTEKIFWDNWDNRTLLTSLPSDLEWRLRLLSTNPLPWLYGHLLGYYLRPSQRLKTELQMRMTDLEFKHPVVGVHVRRTDKVGKEGSYHSVEEYMIQVENYYETLALSEGDLQERRVFVATDDHKVLQECIIKYPKYKFLFHNKTASLAEDLSTRYNYNSVKGALLDVFLLAQTDFLVGTFSSGFSRLAYELMQYYREDSLENVYSLDVEFHYVGALNPHRVVVYDHRGKGEKDLSLLKGDVMMQPYIHSFQDDAIHGKIRDGYSWGRNHRTNLDGNFPLYKTKNVFSVVNVTDS